LVNRDQYDWEGVTLRQFVGCGEWNLASNRQTRMLAEYDQEFNLCGYLASVNKTTLDNELLARAQRSLVSLSFFGLAEYQNYSMRLFEKMFNSTLKFNKPDEIVNPGKLAKELASVRMRHKTNLLTDSVIGVLSKRMLRKINYLNRLDLSLYGYAKSLFYQRLKHHGIEFAEL
jgi:hypothetical protein